MGMRGCALGCSGLGKGELASYCEHGNGLYAFKLQGIFGISPGVNTLSRRTLKFGVIFCVKIWMCVLQLGFHLVAVVGRLVQK
jgi:hypothetical protein